MVIFSVLNFLAPGLFTGVAKEVDEVVAPDALACWLSGAWWMMCRTRISMCFWRKVSSLAKDKDSSKHVIETLEKLGELKEKGVITEEEFEAQKEKLLARL